MFQQNAGRWLAALIAVSVPCLLLWVGCGKDLMGADGQGPDLDETAITHPQDGAALSSTITDIRGRAEVGASVEIGINGDFSGGYTATAWPAAEGGGVGRFTVEAVDLGEEGPKLIEANITDLFGNPTPSPVTISVTLDTTAPAVAFVNLREAQWDDEMEHWTTGVPRITLVCTSDTSATGARVRYGINEFRADSLGPDGELRRYRIPMTAPLLTPAHPESLVHYQIEAFDDAGNVGAEPLTIFWAAAGKETVLTYDDGHPDFIQNNTTGQNGMQLAVYFQAPPWANYVTGAEFYIMNDNQTNPNDPQAPSTRPFRIFVWRPTQDERPGIKANDGYTPCGEFGCYPEAQLVGWDFPNAIEITNHQHFPNKTFFLGMEWLHRNNPYIGLDPDDPIDSRSFRWNWTEWEMMTLDAIVHARVSDLQTTGDRARTAVLKPVAYEVIERE
jgi:hypothetical protein